MIRIRHLVAHGTLALALTLVGAPALAQYASPVRDVENPARTPFWASDTIDIAPGFAGVLNSPIATIPDDQRLVIEQVSMRCHSPSGNPIIHTDIRVTERLGGGSSRSHALQVPIDFQGTDPFNGPIYVGQISSRIYSDAGLSGSSSVSAGVIRASGTGTGVCFVTISGYTISL
jgi:hypothetical protein